MLRFININEKDVNELKYMSKCKNTIRSTNSWVRSYDAWRRERNIPEKLEERIQKY